MSDYSYEAVDAGGLKIQGTLDVVDQNEAIRRVKEMGLFPVRIAAAREFRKKRLSTHLWHEHIRLEDTIELAFHCDIKETAF